MTDKFLGIYIHIPFCRKKCFYCDFPSSAGQEDYFEDYTHALVREITDQGVCFSGFSVDTIFIGGGTPTILLPSQLLTICQAIRTSFRITKEYEWTVEANPGTVNLNDLMQLRQMGVNRISFGVQSFDNDLLRQLGRIHNAEEAVRSVKLAEEAGFSNVNIDLMTGLPGQSLEKFAATIRQAITLPIHHLSVYSLIVEEGTVFAEQAQEGKLRLPDEVTDEAIDEFLAVSLLKRRFLRYEISNYAQNGYLCRHNLKYWRYQPYLGLGAAAHSFLNGQRQANIRDVAAYIKSITAGQSAVAAIERLPGDVAQGEMIFLALRTADGLFFTDYQNQFHRDFLRDYENIVTKLCEQLLIEWDARGIRMTDQGMKFGNVVFRAFLP